MSKDKRSVPKTALERKLVRAIRRLDMTDQVEVLAIVTALGDGRISGVQVENATAHGDGSIRELAEYCRSTQPSVGARAA